MKVSENIHATSVETVSWTSSHPRILFDSMNLLTCIVSRVYIHSAGLGFSPWPERFRLGEGVNGFIK